MVVRPRCRGVHSALATSPIGTAAKKLVLLSTVVVDWPGLRLAVVAVPPRLSAKAMRAPPCMIPKRLLRSSRAASSAVTRSGDMCVILRPRNSAKGGCLFAASFIMVVPRPPKYEGRGRYRPRPLRAMSRVLVTRLWHDADIGPRRLEALGPDFLCFVIADRARDDDVFALLPVRRSRNPVLGRQLK